MTKLFRLFKKRLQKLTPFETFVFISLAAALVFLMRYFLIREEWKTIRVEVIGNSWSTSYNPYGYRTPFWLSTQIKKGQTEKDSGGKIIAEIVDIENYERGDEEAEVYLTVKVKTFFNRRIGKYIFKGRALDLGAPIELRPANIFIPGQIIDNNAPPQGYETKEILVQGIQRGQNPWFINQVTPGDKMYNRADQSVIAEILNTEIKPTTTSIFLYDGRIEHDPEKKDFIIKAKIKAFRLDGGWFFAGHQKVKVGNLLWIYTDKVDLGFEIQTLEDVPLQ